MALDPQRNEKILDMCSAPGGKTTHIAQIMRNSGIVLANDINKARQKATVFNLERMGVKNCIVVNLDGKQLK